MQFANYLRYIQPVIMAPQISIDRLAKKDPETKTWICLVCDQVMINNRSDNVRRHYRRKHPKELAAMDLNKRMLESPIVRYAKETPIIFKLFD